MDTTRIMSIFIIIIMVASMAGVAVLMSQPAEEEKPYEQPPQELLEEQPPIESIGSYRSKAFDANVMEIFPSLTLTAQTEETEINLIDAEIYGVTGVTRVDSRYVTENMQITTGGLTYAAEISFPSDFNNQEVLAAIKASTTKLSFIDAYSSALLQIPVTLELVNVDDENDVKEYTFAEPFTQGYISIETQKGDTISAIEQAVFSGDNLVQSIAFESRNISAEPMQFSLEEEVTISGLTSSARLAGEIAYSGQNFDLLEQELAAFEGIESVDLQTVLSGSFIEFIFDQNQPQETLEDLNQSLSALAGVKQVSFSQEFFYLGFEEAADYPLLKQNIESVLSEKGVSAQLNDPSVYLSGDLNAASNDLAAINSHVLAVLEEANTKDVLFKQQGSIKLNQASLTDPDSGESYPTDQNQTVFDAWLTPGHQVGEKISLKLDATAMRGQITAIFAVEE